MSRVLVLCGLFLLTVPAGGQAGKPAYQMPAPQGWAKETIPLPPGFAPDMKWKGAEELRFAPGMYKPESDTFFSYAILFWLPGEQKVDAKSIEQEMLAYYRGLFQAVAKGKKLDVDASKFSVSLKDTTAAKPGQRPTGEELRQYAGELKWVEPFVTGKPQTLRLEIHTWYCDKSKHTCVFMAVSPQPETAAVWKALRDIRMGCTCHPVSH
jgi:hypothetical protein